MKGERLQIHQKENKALREVSQKKGTRHAARDINEDEREREGG